MILFVCGLPRSGMSIVMQMLAAGDLPLVGTFPNYECPQAGVVAWDVFEQFNGHAVKIVDPAAISFEWLSKRVPAKAIYISRDPLECANSSWRIAAEGRLGLATLMAKTDVGKIHELASIYRREQYLAENCVARSVHGAVMRTTFTELLHAPRVVGGKIVEFLQIDKRGHDKYLIEALLDRMEVQVRVRTTSPAKSSLNAKRLLLPEFGRQVWKDSNDRAIIV